VGFEFVIIINSVRVSFQTSSSSSKRSFVDSGNSFNDHSWHSDIRLEVVNKSSFLGCVSINDVGNEGSDFDLQSLEVVIIEGRGDDRVFDEDVLFSFNSLSIGEVGGTGEVGAEFEGGLDLELVFTTVVRVYIFVGVDGDV